MENALLKSMQLKTYTWTLTRIAPAKHSQRRDGRFIFPSSSLIFRNRRKGSFAVRKLCGRLTETYNYVFHCRNLFLPPLALFQYVRVILVLGRWTEKIVVCSLLFKFLPHQKMFITAKVIERQSFMFAIICCLRNVVCGVIKERKSPWKRAQIGARFKTS